MQEPRRRKLSRELKALQKTTSRELRALLKTGEQDAPAHRTRAKRND